jgi:hypothetical protein
MNFLLQTIVPETENLSPFATDSVIAWGTLETPRVPFVVELLNIYSNDGVGEKFSLSQASGSKLQARPEEGLPYVGIFF